MGTAALGCFGIGAALAGCGLGLAGAAIADMGMELCTYNEQLDVMTEQCLRTLLGG